MDVMKKFWKRYRSDLTLILPLIGVTLVLFAVFSFVSRPGMYANVTVNGVRFGVYRLDTDCEIDVNGTNRLVIENGTIRMEEADCPHKSCVARGAISRQGQMIVCLPNGVAVTIIGVCGVDAVSG